jgi:lincosamide nucleotidyltransferase A/C/D/E
VDAWVDGGWGIDALLSRERRQHGDLDLVVRLDQVGAAAAALRHLGFAPAVDVLPVRLVLAATDDRRIDLHPTVTNEHGDALQAQPFGRVFAYPRGSLLGRGTIAGRAVRCLTADGQVLAHLGYQPAAVDRADVKALADRFAVGLGLAFADGDDRAVRAASRADIAPMTDVQLRASVAAYRWPGNEAWADSVHHGTYWRLWESRIGAPRTWSGVALVGGAVAGTAHVRPWASDDLDSSCTAELNAVYVDPHAQGTGVGRRLNDAALVAAREMGYTDVRLHVIELNRAGQRFWERLGWQRDGGTREVTGSGGMIEHRYGISSGVSESHR